MSTGLFRCSACKLKVSIISGTGFQSTRKPLRFWFQVILYVASQKFGGSPLGLKHDLIWENYQTAWSKLHKMRRAMVRDHRSALSVDVKVDETLVGGKDQKDKSGRVVGNKVIVLIVLEVHAPERFGLVRMQRIPDASEDSLIPFVRNNIKSVSVVITDSWKGYNMIEKYG